MSEPSNFIHVEGNLRGVRYKFMLDAGTRDIKLDDFDAVVDIIDAQRELAFKEAIADERARKAQEQEDLLAMLLQASFGGRVAQPSAQPASAGEPPSLAPAPVAEPEEARAGCPACGKTVSVNADGSLRVHGPKDARCSGLAPVAVQEQPEATPAPVLEVLDGPAEAPAKDWFEDDEEDASSTSVDSIAAAVF